MRVHIDTRSTVFKPLILQVLFGRVSTILKLGVEDTVSLHGVTFEDGPAGRPLVLQEGVAVGAAVADGGRDINDPPGLASVTGVAPCPWVPWTRTLSLGDLGRRGVGLDGPLGRGGRRAEKTRRGLPLLVTALLPKALEFLGEPIDLPLFLQTLGTPIDRHHHSRPDAAASPQFASVRHRAETKGARDSYRAARALG